MHHMNGSYQIRDANIVRTMHLHTGISAYQLDNLGVTRTQMQYHICTVMVTANCFSTSYRLYIHTAS